MGLIQRIASNKHADGKLDAWHYKSYSEKNRWLRTKMF